MTKLTAAFVASLLGALSLPSAADEATEGCRANPLFTVMPGYHVYDCASSDFDAKRFPVDVDPADDTETRFETIEGAYSYVIYQVDEGVKPASTLQILCNHLNAAKAAGAVVVRDFGPESRVRSEWVDIQQHIATLRLAQGGGEYWIHLGAFNEGDFYGIAMVRREAMAQAVSANAMLDEMNRNGFLTIEVPFDTAKATIRPESAATLDSAAGMLKAAPTLAVEVAGHTDNSGTPAGNETLSQQRAESVRAALIERGIPTSRLTAKGYGQSNPVADNRSEDGRAKNRRVELVRK